MESTLYLYLSAGCILILAKVASRISVRYRQPPVLGMLILGLILGPSGLNLLRMDITLKWLSEVGVLLLLFMAGLESEIQLMRRQGKAGLFCACGGIILPFFLGSFLAVVFGYELNRALFLGTLLTATSVSVTVMTLFGLDRLSSVEGSTILTAAILDDIVAVVIIGVIMGLTTAGVSPGFAVLKITGFFAAIIALGFFAFRPLIYFCEKSRIPQMTLAVTMGLVFIFAWFARVMGVAPVTGGYFAGLFLGRIQPMVKKKLLGNMDIIGQSFFIPFFFVGMGLEVAIKSIHGSYLFLFFFLLVAVFGKFAGSALASRLAGLSRMESFRVGAGMIPRGEVALAIASLGVSHNLITRVEFSSTVVMVIVTVLLTPILLKRLFEEKKRR